MNPYAQAYISSRDAVCDLVATIPSDRWEFASPLTPAWKVREVLAHLVGVSSDIVAMNMPKGDMDEWTSRQVANGAHLSLEGLIELWYANKTEDVIDQNLAVMVYDQLSHEYDIRYALGSPGTSTSPGISLSCEFILATFSKSKDARFSFDLDGTVLEAGEGGERVSLKSSRFELMRARSGRRSWDEISEMDWTGDLEVVREAFFGNGFFKPASFRVNETTL